MKFYSSTANKRINVAFKTLFYMCILMGLYGSQRKNHLDLQDQLSVKEHSKFNYVKL
jgi:hypothetical protein